MYYLAVVKPVVLFAVIVIFLSACMSKAVVVLYGQPYPTRIDSVQIDVYRSIKPSKAYIEVGEISCRDTNKEWALNQLKIKAREIGADGLIILGPGTTTSGGYVVGNVVVSSIESHGYNAIAIRYKD